MRFSTTQFVTFPITWYSIHQCGHPIHKNELLIGMLPYLIYRESIAPRFLHFYAFIICSNYCELERKWLNFECTNRTIGSMGCHQYVYALIGIICKLAVYKVAWERG